MELSINGLVEAVDEFLLAQQTARYRATAGLDPARSATALFNGTPLVAHPDAVQYVAELIESPRTDETRRGRLELLRDFLIRCSLERGVSEAQDSLDAFRQQAAVPTPSKTWALDDALRSLPTLAQHDHRDVVEKESTKVIEAALSRWERLIDAGFRAAGALKAPTLRDAWPKLNTQHQPERLAAAQAFLARTADAYRDVLGYALKRVDPSLKPSTARLHDIERAALAPWLFESFRREDIWHALTRCHGDLGLAPNAGGRIFIDQETRPGRVAGAHVFTPRVPDEIRLALSAEGGFASWGAWQRAWGQAQFFANIGRTLPLVERALGDTALSLSVGGLFESWLGDAGWLKRYARLSSAAAKDAARLFAFHQLAYFRRHAALLAFDDTVAREGLTAAALDEGRTRLGDALFAEVPRGAVLLEVTVLGDRRAVLDALALETALHGQLTERFNEDYWRNPATGRFLTELAARGTKEPALAVAKSGPKAASIELEAAGLRRVAVMNG